MSRLLKKTTMSRIGKKIIELPKGVTLSVGSDNTVTVKGPKGELKQQVDRDITIAVNENVVEFKRPTDQIRHRALHGLYRALVNNLVNGVTNGFKKELELVGVRIKINAADAAVNAAPTATAPRPNLRIIGDATNDPNILENGIGKVSNAAANGLRPKPI